jgi:hypothetical protein
MNYDRVGFLSNIIASISNYRVLEIIEFLSKSFIDNIETYRRCWCLPDKREIDCNQDCTSGDEREFVMIPVGWWNEYEIKNDKRDWTEYYNFAKDFFKTIGESRADVFDQYIRNANIRILNNAKYAKSGFPLSNYQFDCRATVDLMLEKRFTIGNADIDTREFDAYRESIYNRFKVWYSKSSSFSSKILTVYMDEPTILHLTNLKKVDTWDNFDLAESHIRSILGNPHCVGTSADGTCITLSYGYPLNDENKVVLPNTVPNGKGGTLHKFIFIRHTYYENKPNGYWEQELEDLSETDRNALSSSGISPETAMMSTLNSVGMIGGKTIFNYGEGTEWKLSSRFSDFLRYSNMTSEDFLDTLVSIPEETLERMERHNFVSKRINPQNIVEFYDSNHVSPLDDISAYIPMLVGGVMNITISTREEDSNGVVTIEETREIIADNSVHQIVFNKNEFVSKIEGSGPYYFVGEYMNLDIDIKFSDSPVEADTYNLRFFTSDNTVLTKKAMEFMHV